MPAAAMAAAASSWVEKMLHEDQVTSAPRATRVSMRTAVCVVMWRQPAIRAPLSGAAAPYLESSGKGDGRSAPRDKTDQKEDAKKKNM